MYAPHRASEATQMKDELDMFKRFLKTQGVKSYLEIGARCGDSFDAVMRELGPESYGLAVDLPGGKWGQDDSRQKLELVAERLRNSGIYANLIFGNSRDPEIIDLVSQMKFDAILIDGDHSQDGVEADFKNYGHLGRIVCFHDIVWQPDGNEQIWVPRFWRQLKSKLNANEMAHEIVAPHSRMGIGCVVRA